MAIPLDPPFRDGDPAPVDQLKRKKKEKKKENVKSRWTICELEKGDRDIWVDSTYTLADNQFLTSCFSFCAKKT